MPQPRYVLLDRDGTINIDCHYLSNPDDLRFCPGAVMGMRKLRLMGLGLIVITNQSGISRGYFDRATLDRVHARMIAQLATEGVEVDGIYVCPHGPDDNCCCRKPRTGLVEQAIRDFQFAPHDTFVVGDKPTDIAVGQAFGATTFLVENKANRNGKGGSNGQGSEEELAASLLCQPDYKVEDLIEVAEIIQRRICGHYAGLHITHTSMCETPTTEVVEDSAIETGQQPNLRRSEKTVHEHAE